MSFVNKIARGGGVKLSNAIPYLYDKLLSFFYKGSM